MEHSEESDAFNFNQDHEMQKHPNIISSLHSYDLHNLIHIITIG